jgi:hypothetical protein
MKAVIDLDECDRRDPVLRISANVLPLGVVEFCGVARRLAASIFHFVLHRTVGNVHGHQLGALRLRRGALWLGLRRPHRLRLGGVQPPRSIERVRPLRRHACHESERNSGV